MKYVGYRQSATVAEAVARFGAAVQTKVKRKKAKAANYARPWSAPYGRRPEQIAHAIALAKQRTGEKDLPAHPSPPIAPKSDRLVQLELDAFAAAELAKARRESKSTREQLSLF